VLRLEERLSYTHKGIEKRFASMAALDGHRLAGRVSGDSTVAYAWAYAQALEALAATAVPPRASWLRALALERERIANHLGDLGYLGNDGGFAFGLAQFSRLKEQVLRLNHAAFGHRFMMDQVVPGGVARDLDLTETALREWVKRALADRTHGKTGLTTAEREELARLRRENRILREEREILKKAAAFFANERR